MVWHLAWEYLKIQQNQPAQNEIIRLQQIKRKLEYEKVSIPNSLNSEDIKWKIDEIDEQIDVINEAIKTLKDTLLK